MDYLPEIYKQADTIFFQKQNRIESIIDQKPINYLDNYLLNNIVVSPIKNLIAEISKEHCPSAVLTNAAYLIEKLPESFFVKLNSDSFYKSKYNTLIIDYEDASTCLTIDIGSKSFGFFIEKDDVVVDLKESLSTEFKAERQIHYGILNQAIINHIL